MRDPLACEHAGRHAGAVRRELYFDGGDGGTKRLLGLGCQGCTGKREKGRKGHDVVVAPV